MKLFFALFQLLVFVTAKKHFFCTDNVCVSCFETPKFSNCPTDQGATLLKRAVCRKTCEDKGKLCDRKTEPFKEIRSWKNELRTETRKSTIETIVNRHEKRNAMRRYHKARKGINDAFLVLAKIVCSDDLGGKLSTTIPQDLESALTKTASGQDKLDVIWLTVRDSLLAPILDRCSDCADLVEMLNRSFELYVSKKKTQIPTATTAQPVEKKKKKTKKERVTAADCIDQFANGTECWKDSAKCSSGVKGITKTSTASGKECDKKCSLDPWKLSASSSNDVPRCSFDSESGSREEANCYYLCPTDPSECINADQCWDVDAAEGCDVAQNDMLNDTLITKTTTVSGKVCMRWDEVYPDTYDSVIGKADDTCTFRRDRDTDMFAPWCYTKPMARAVDREYCFHQSNQCPEQIAPFQCSDGSGPAPFPPNRFCDNFQDCDDNSDEADCPTPGEFTCQDGSGRDPFPQVWVCDGTKQCDDNSDEADCPIRFYCEDFTIYKSDPFSQHAVCDFNNDCDDGSDEVNCPYGFQCAAYGHYAIPESYVCDFWADCDDASDEADCTNGFLCLDGSGVYGRVDSDYVCDDYDDCDDGSDELDCSSHEFTCADGSGAIQPSDVCDFYAHCDDASDEADCTDGFYCADGSGRQGSGRVYQHHVCDGDYDCDDGSDEAGCPTDADACIYNNDLCWDPTADPSCALVDIYIDGFGGHRITKTTTVSGKDCLRWDQLSANVPGKSDNTCTYNYWDMAPAPWCRYGTAEGDWEYCYYPKDQCPGHDPSVCIYNNDQCWNYTAGPGCAIGKDRVLDDSLITKTTTVSGKECLSWGDVQYKDSYDGWWYDYLGYFWYDNPWDYYMEFNDISKDVDNSCTYHYSRFTLAPWCFVDADTWAWEYCYHTDPENENCLPEPEVTDPPICVYNNDQCWDYTAAPGCARGEDALLDDALITKTTTVAGDNCVQGGNADDSCTFINSEAVAAPWCYVDDDGNWEYCYYTSDQCPESA